MLWFQGFADAPDLVRKCLDSWKRWNPTWRVVTLDDDNLSQYVDIDDIVRRNRTRLTRQARSDVVRINLLKEHGGVWVDATCFCCRPLDEWLADYTRTGFFAFRNPTPGQAASSWFLAASPDSTLASQWCRAVNDYWKQRSYTRQNTRLGRVVRQQTYQRLKFIPHDSRRSRAWLRVLRLARIYPYFWFHYLFNELVTTDDACRREWQLARPFSADVPHRVMHFGFFKPLSVALKQEIDERRAPLYKLDWRLKPARFPSGSAIDYLLGSPETAPEV